MSGVSLRFLDERLSREKEYWLRKLSGDLVITGIPLDYRRPATLRHEKAALDLKIDSDIARRLRKICGNRRPLVFSVLVTALKICLHKYTGAEDIIIGTTAPDQSGELASLNRVLALRNCVSKSLTVRFLLEDVKQTISEAYANRKYPFKRLLELLSVEWPINRSPLFNVAAVLKDIHDEENVRYLKNDVTLIFSECGSVLSGTIEFAPSLFKLETIEVFRGHYQRVLEIVLNSPDLRISEIDLLTQERKQELVFDFNQTESDYPRDKTIHHLFQEQVAHAPGDVAVTFGDSQLTYEELNRRANQVAHYLRKLGVGRGKFVGLFMDHSIEMVVSLLGILKAGGAYVPFDTAHPRTRLAFMLEDARISLVLTQQRVADRLPPYGGDLLRLDDDWDRVAQESEQNPVIEAGPHDPAYLIYTSGSTGAPKGVKIQHRGLVNYIWWAKNVYLKGERAAFALYSSPAFDLTVTSIFTPLITGNRIVVYYWEGRDPRLDDIITDNQVDIIKLTPSHLSLIKDLNSRQSKVRRLIVGGEALETELLRQIVEKFSEDVEIFNEYGPTEATVGCMIHQYDHLKDNRAFVPIGRPAANSQIYVLDEDSKPVAENMIGELYISGEGLSEGYFDREDLTAERFIENPLFPGQRMYKTGDLARWLPGDMLEYLGRADDQVKFHGYRVELGEIRCALNQHPQVRDSVVVLTKDSYGYDVMVAYYASRQELDQTHLREFMAETVIEETIPNFFVHLRKLPLTLNGKINYSALPDLNEAKKRIKRTYEPPSTTTERLLAGIWSEVLGTEQVSIRDNFFGLGGHSLLATQVISRVRDAFHVELPLRSLFESPTIISFAGEVDARTKAERRVIAPPITRTARDKALPLSFAQQRLWFIDQLESGSFAYNMPVALRLEGPLDAAALARSINEVVKRHETLRTTFISVDDQPVQIIAPSYNMPLPVIDLLDLPKSDREQEARRLAYAEARQLFDMARGPLLQVKLLRLSDTEHALFLTMHHIISDGWSMGVFVRELMTLYRGGLEGQQPSLPDLPIQYADFAAWQRQWLQGEVLEAQLAYWRYQLAGAPPVSELPIDRPRQGSHEVEGSTQSFLISKDVTESLKDLSLQEEVTLFMTLLAAFKTLLYRSTKQEDVIVGTGIANRNRAETEQLIGFFINMIVLRTDLSGNLSFRELLKRVKTVTLEAFAYQDVPFEKLVEELQPDRRNTDKPWLQAVFEFQNIPSASIECPGLKIEHFDNAMAPIHFDMLMVMAEVEQGLAGSLTYNTSLFHSQTIDNILKYYQILLAQAVANPDLKLLDIPLAMEERAAVSNDSSRDRSEQFIF